jgi:FdhD protein
MHKKVNISKFPLNEARVDSVAEEEPLEIRVNGESCAVLMRTPGMDRELAAGFLLTEGVVDGADDIRAIEPCGDPSRPHAENIIQVSLAEGCAGAQERLARATRQFFTSSSCGLCGKATIENIHQIVSPHSEFVTIPESLVSTVGERVLREQQTFQQTGGLHAAALFHLGQPAELRAVAEDIGRHNAVDKILGRMLLANEIPVSNTVMWVSGRSSFEVIQKALMGGVSGLICVGAPSSLAVELAIESKLTLVGFARGGAKFNVYSGYVGK